MMKTSNPPLVPASAFLSTRRVFENNDGIYFFFFAAGRAFPIYEEHTRLAAVMSSAEPQPPSLLASNVCMYIRDFLHDPNFATF
jgi:hypothetical protein